MRDRWYGDNHDLVKWGVLLKLANLYGASRIVQVAYYRPETIEIDGDRFPTPDAVMTHFSRSIIDIARLNVGDSPSVQINVVNSPLLSRAAYIREVQAALAKLLSLDSPCIIFLDPDTGLEPQDHPSLEHALESELAQIWKALRGKDVLVFYQHKPRIARTKDAWWKPKQRQFECALGLSMGAAKMARGEAATDIVFFFAQKSPATDPTKTAEKMCPECDHEFKGNGFDGIDAHWRAKHEHIMLYKEAWPLIKSGNYHRRELRQNRERSEAGEPKQRH